MYTPEFKNILTSTLDGLRAEGLYKEERFIASQQYSQVTLKDGRSVINMCANNYLGLANNPEVMEAAKKAIDQWGFGMASVRFICGTQTPSPSIGRTSYPISRHGRHDFVSLLL